LAKFEDFLPESPQASKLFTFSMEKQLVGPASCAMGLGSAGLLARAYFRMKPFIPGRLRWALRRARADGILKRNRETWPVNEAAAKVPQNWTGWPEGKSFAFVLTHDVESRVGVENVRKLAAIESRFGLRSAYNFIPEGPYQDPFHLRRWLADRGFEVGVHDLNHDGHLYTSRKQFRKKAARINDYLKQWGAVGFRSGFMLRELDWLHDLDLLYDASTFDTDPFEPQPEGAQTIFPFLVKKGDGSPGYVELPYTLPQDSTLFLLLREQTPAIWMRKLDWIARHGGLALVNIHPDYIRFADSRGRSWIYPASILEELLGYLDMAYAGRFWNPLPRELAAWFRVSCVNSADPAPGVSGACV